MQNIIGCSAKMISNALKWRAKPDEWQKTLDNHQNGSKNNQNGKGSANDQLQDDQTQSGVTCTVTVGRRLCEANLFTRIPKVAVKKKKGMCRRGYHLPKNTSTGDLLAVTRQC